MASRRRASSATRSSPAVAQLGIDLHLHSPVRVRPASQASRSNATCDPKQSPGFRRSRRGRRAGRRNSRLERAHRRTLRPQPPVHRLQRTLPLGHVDDEIVVRHHHRGRSLGMIEARCSNPMTWRESSAGSRTMSTSPSRSQTCSGGSWRLSPQARILIPPVSTSSRQWSQERGLWRRGDVHPVEPADDFAEVVDRCGGIGRVLVRDPGDPHIAELPGSDQAVDQDMGIEAVAAHHVEVGMGRDPTSTVVGGKSSKNQSQRRDGWFLHGSTMTVRPPGEVILKADPAEYASSTGPGRGRRPARSSSIIRLWFDRCLQACSPLSRPLLHTALFTAACACRRAGSRPPRYGDRTPRTRSVRTSRYSEPSADGCRDRDSRDQAGVPRIRQIRRGGGRAPRPVSDGSTATLSSRMPSAVSISTSTPTSGRLPRQHRRDGSVTTWP